MLVLQTSRLITSMNQSSSWFYSRTVHSWIWPVSGPHLCKMLHIYNAYPVPRAFVALPKYPASPADWVSLKWPCWQHIASLTFCGTLQLIANETDRPAAASRNGTVEIASAQNVVRHVTDCVVSNLASYQLTDTECSECKEILQHTTNMFAFSVLLYLQLMVVFHTQRFGHMYLPTLRFLRLRTR